MKGRKKYKFVTFINNKLNYNLKQTLLYFAQSFFGDKAEKVDTTGEVIDRWELIKAEEKKKKFGENEKISIFKNLPPRLPALLFANDIYKRVAKNGLEEKGEWEENNASVSAQELNEELAGKALFELVAACQKSGIDPELALRRFSSAQVKKLED